MQGCNQNCDIIEEIKHHLELSFEIQGQIKAEFVEDPVYTLIKISVKTALFDYEHYYKSEDYESCYQIATRFTQDYAEHILYNFIGMRVDCLFDGHFVGED